MSNKPWENETSPQTTTSTDQTTTESLLGSDVQPAEFIFNGETVTLGQVVAFAHAKSELSTEAWNSLADEEREKHIQAVVDEHLGQELDFDGLKARADELGVAYAANIGEDTLRARVAEAEAAAQPPDLNSKGKPKTGALSGSEANVDTAADVDGTAAEQDERVVASSVVISGHNASLALTGLVSRGYSVAEARKLLGE